MFLPVILSGGSGERLWPVSRASHPKPFITLPDGQSLIQKSFLRALMQNNASEVLTVTHQSHHHKTREAYDAIPHAGVATPFILEPVGRNTAPAMAMAAHYAVAMHGEETILLVLPADHIVEDNEGFRTAVNHARSLAEQGYLVTFGVSPTSAETGYGYIEAGEVLPGGNAVRRFVEKPDALTAEACVASGNYRWNAGIFCCKASVFLRELAAHAPVLDAQVRHALPTNWHAGSVALDASLFSEVSNISVDVAVMEKSAHGAVVSCDVGWSDVGCWAAMSQCVAPDEHSNRILGNALIHDSSNCYIYAGANRVVGAVGLHDLMIIDTPDALLVANRASSQQVKEIAKAWQQQPVPSGAVARPWGSYTVLQESEGVKIKRIEMLPGKKLSLQVHHHRSEHWVVVSGQARVQNGDAVLDLLPSQSAYIPAGQKHRLENIGDTALSIVEVQCGAYLGEDDITRFDDCYDRENS